MKPVYIILIVAVSVTLGALLSRSFRAEPESSAPVVLRDTVTVRDTIYPPVPEPVYVTSVRYDTVRDTLIQRQGDGYVLPISSKTYVTEDYRATVEGYNPRLTNIELYPKTVTVTNTVHKRPRWTISAGVGLGYGPKGIEPHIGITAGLVVWSK